MTAPTPREVLACRFGPTHEPWSCRTHPAGYRTALDETECSIVLGEGTIKSLGKEIRAYGDWRAKTARESIVGRWQSLHDEDARANPADHASACELCYALTRREPLDVERLARAFLNTESLDIHPDGDPWSRASDEERRGARFNAEAIAAEYARLEAADA